MAEVLPAAEIDPRSLGEFLDELRAEGYSIGTNQYIQAQDLLLAFVAGRERGSWSSFPSLLGPVVCKSPSQQAEFGRRYDRWHTRRLPPASPAMSFAKPTEKERAVELDRELNAVQRANRIGLWVTTAIVVLALGAAFWILRPAQYVRLPWKAQTRIGTAPPPVPEPEPAPIQAPAPARDTIGRAQTFVPPPRHFLAVGVVAASITLPLVAGWWFWWRRRARRFLRARSVLHSGEMHLRVATAVAEFFDRSTVDRVTPALRRRIPIPSGYLAVDATIQRTIDRGGWFTPVYGQQFVTPEYVVLIERSWRGDQTRGSAERLVTELSRRDVALRCYYFEDSPDIVFPATGPEPAESEAAGGGGQHNGLRVAAASLFLKDVALRHSSDRLILVADAAVLIRKSHLELAAWYGRFQLWAYRILLTPPGYDEHVPQFDFLKDHFLVAPITDDGIVGLARVLQGGPAPATAQPAPFHALPATLLMRPEIWLDRLKPPDSQIEELLLSLRNYLGPNGFAWLAACAVYPAIREPLTVYLGNVLRSESGKALFSLPLLAALHRLVWLREGYMPEWMRLALIREMPIRFEAQVRDVLYSLLLTALRGDISGLELAIAQQHRHVVARLVRSALSNIGGTVEPGSDLKDRVFLSFLSGRTAVSIPEALRNLLLTGTTRGRLDPEAPAVTRRARKLIFTSLSCWAGVGVSTLLAVVWDFLYVLPVMLLGLLGLSVPLLVHGYKRKNYWATGVGILDAWMWVQFLPAVGFPSIAAIMLTVLVALCIVAVHLLAARSVRFQRETITLGPVRKYVGTCLAACGFLLFVGVPVASLVASLINANDDFITAIWIAVAILPVALGALVFVAGRTNARTAYILGCIGVYGHIAVVLTLLSFLGGVVTGRFGVVSAAIAGVGLTYAALRSWMHDGRTPTMTAEGLVPREQSAGNTPMPPHWGTE